MSVVSLRKGAALKCASQLSLLCAPFSAKPYQLLIASFAHCTFCGVRILRIAVSPQNGSCHRRYNWTTTGLLWWLVRKPTEKSVCSENPRAGGAVWLCSKPEEHAWLCAALPIWWLCHQGASLCSVLQLTQRSQGNSLLGASAETSLPSSRGCCGGIIIRVRDKTDPKPNLKWKQMQFQLT